MERIMRPEIKRPDWITNVILHFNNPDLDTGVGMKKTMSRAQMDAILEVVNLQELKQSLVKQYGREVYVEMMQEQSNKLPYIDVADLVTDDDYDSFQKAHKNSDAERAAESINESRKDAADELHEKLDKEPELQPPGEEVYTGPIVISGLTKDDFKPKLQAALSAAEIKKGYDPRAIKANVLSEESLENIYQVMSRIFGFNEVSGDTALTQFSMMRYSDGSYNIVTQHALYSGMLFKPADQFQSLKDVGETAKGMEFKVFAKGKEGEQKIIDLEHSLSSSKGAPTPFDTKLAPGSAKGQ